MAKINSPNQAETLKTSTLVRPSSLGIETSQLDVHELHDPSGALRSRIELATTALIAFIKADLPKVLEPTIIEPLQVSIQSILQLHLIQDSSISANLQPHVERIERFSILLKIFSQTGPAAIGFNADEVITRGSAQEKRLLRQIAKHWQLWFEILDSARELNNELKSLLNSLFKK